MPPPERYKRQHPNNRGILKYRDFNKIYIETPYNGSIIEYMHILNPNKIMLSKACISLSITYVGRK